MGVRDLLVVLDSVVFALEMTLVASERLAPNDLHRPQFAPRVARHPNLAVAARADTPKQLMPRDGRLLRWDGCGIHHRGSFPVDEVGASEGGGGRSSSSTRRRISRRFSGERSSPHLLAGDSCRRFLARTSTLRNQFIPIVPTDR